MFIARVHCPSTVCLGFHRLCWDDVKPPDPAKTYCYACPYKGRMVIVNIKDAEWFMRGTSEARLLQGMAAQLMEWDQRSAGWGAVAHFG